MAAALFGCKRETSGAADDGGDAIAARAAGDDAAPGSDDAGSTAADTRFRSTDGNFAVRFPYPGTEPKTEVRPITGGFEHVAKVTGDLGTYLVGYDDTLKFADPRSSKRVLDDVMANTLRANHGKLEKQTAVTLGGKHPGRAFEASMIAKDKRPIRGTFHVYVVRTRVYQVVALTPADKTVPDEMKSGFFGSFSLLEPR